MIPDEVLKVQGLRALIAALGDVEAERFVSLLTKAPFDYTKWRKELFSGVGVEALSHAAMQMRLARERSR